MHRENLLKLMDSEFARIREDFESKAADYASAEDALRDFKDAGADAEVDPRIVWLIWATKHWNAVKTYARTGGLESEGIEPRVRDVIGYGILLLALAEDERRDQDTVEFTSDEPPGNMRTEG